MKKIAYIDCPTGISGDMFLAAAIDAGLPEKNLLEELKKLEITGYKIDTGRRDKNGLSGHYFEVLINKQHCHRSWKDIQEIIEKSSLTLPVKKKSLSVFDKLAAAEAKAHGVSKEDVHFHEVGAIDSIVDIVGAAIAVDYFRINKLYISPLPMGKGWVRSAHGLIPLPAPATLLLLENCPVYPLPVDSELVTPTGAALAAALADCFSGWPAMTITKVGFGAGKLELAERPNILRLAVGRETEKPVIQAVRKAGDENEHGHDHVHGHAHPHGRGHDHDKLHSHHHHLHTHESHEHSRDKDQPPPKPDKNLTKSTRESAQKKKALQR
jgi:uncharacterized protein (TIGR00299 family) protein